MGTKGRGITLNTNDVVYMYVMNTMARADALLILTENPTNRKVEGYQYGCKPGKTQGKSG